ncbi:UNVERIFIED_CONTAM: CRISPR-associated Cas3 family helicase [Acetivibrio alkalicellulosi]
MPKDIYLYTLEELVLDHEDFIGHTGKNGNENEKLSEHLMLTLNYFEKIIEKKNLTPILQNLFSLFKLKQNNEHIKIHSLIRELFYNAIALHDIGKINPLFQKKIKNVKYINYSDVNLKNSEHSMLSALIYIDIFEKKIGTIKDRVAKYFLKYFIYSFACSISRHHSYLYKLDDFIEKLENCRLNFSIIANDINYKSDTLFIKKHSTNMLELFDRCRNNWEIDEISFYIINKFLYSLIVSSDFYATYNFYEKKEPQMELIDNVEEFSNKYCSTSLYKSIEKYKLGEKTNLSPINTLRTEMFVEAENNLLSQLTKNIFFLEAPTGSGKTNTSINLALKLIESNKELNKIFYVFPFNTLVEQTAEVFSDIFEKGKDFAIINSITPIVVRDNVIDEEDEKIDYETSILDRQFLHYPIIITTHINLFNYLFGNGRELNFPITQLCNSVVILDEIQSYRNKIWSEIINFISRYADILNIKFIVMSATLPRLDKLLFNSEAFGILIKDREKYFSNPIFKDRVKINLRFLEKGKIDLVEIAQFIKEIIHNNPNKKILIEFIKKQTARDFYNIISSDKLNVEVVELTGDDNKYFRNKILQDIKSSNGIIVVATQVIEAGVDIDMDMGFKDISMIDCEEQFMGRINRSCKKTGCEAYFFDYDDTKNIYREDLRDVLDIKTDKGKEAIDTKNFEEYYNLCFENIRQKNNELNKNNLNNLMNYLRYLNYINVSSRMKLICQNTFQIYLEYEIKFQETYISGKEIWDEYIKLCDNRNLSYSKKKIELSKVMEKVYLFTFNLIANDDVSISQYPYIKGFYYVENGDRFIDENGKFDRAKFEESSGGIFL